MSRHLRLWIVIFAGIPFLLLGLLIGIGLLLPAEHVVTSRAAFPVGVDSLWAVMTDFPRVPAWRPDVTRMEQLEDREGHAVWLEVGPTGQIPFEILEADPPRLLVTQIADPDLPFGGRWIYRLEPHGNGSRLTITENGHISNPLFRSVARIVFGFHSTLDVYLRSLGAHLGVALDPEHLETTADGGLEPGL